MDHRGAGWLERTSRATEQRPERVVDATALAPDVELADIGAGTAAGSQADTRGPTTDCQQSANSGH